MTWCGAKRHIRSGYRALPVFDMIAGFERAIIGTTEECAKITEALPQQQGPIEALRQTLRLSRKQRFPATFIWCVTLLMEVRTSEAISLT